MAATTIGAQLTEAHRLAQTRLGAQSVVTVARMWDLLDGQDLDGSFDRWLAAVTPVVSAQRTISTQLASQYLSLFRAVEAGGAAPSLVYAPALDQSFSTSMLVTGPVAAKQAISRGVPLDVAMGTAQGRAAASAMRHVLNGGRETLLSSIDADRQALGWARVTSGAPCGFCAMLASRGGVYRDATVDFQAHDHCSCTVEPIYRSESRLPVQSQRWADLWDEASATAPDDTESEFRRLVTAGS